MVHRTLSSSSFERRRWLRIAGLVVAIVMAATAWAADEDEHWSRQFPKPDRSTEMTAGTGMSDGVGAPSVRSLAWHDGKLWIAGTWETGVDPTNLAEGETNVRWHLWTWSPTDGYQVIAYYHSARGGVGPDGVINDFAFLPDGRLVVAGEFTRVDNVGGNRYHNVNALAIYDPSEPGPDPWRPLGRVQYNGTISPGGSLQSIAYDPQGNDLYIGGGFEGAELAPPMRSSAFHRFDFDSGTYETILYGPAGGHPRVRHIQVDTSTNPSTIYIGGSWHYLGGNGLSPDLSESTSFYSTGFAAWRDDTGWIPYPAAFPTDGSFGGADGVLQRAADFINFDAVVVRDFLVDGDDIWLCGAFSEGIDQEPLRGIARWDDEAQVWVDPTGTGGVGRDCFSVAKSDDGRIYFSGAFGGRRGANEFYDGFLDGTPAHGAIVYDPASDTWSQLGSGLSSRVMPEIRLTTNGSDVYFAGDFTYIDPANFGNSAPAEAQSWYLARWNPTIDFVANPPEVAEGNAPYQAHRPTIGAPEGAEHWSRAFAPPARGESRPLAGMSDGTGVPDISGIVWIGDTLYFGGSWEAERNTRWYAWTFHPERGYERLAWDGGDGIQSPPEGIKAFEGRLYAFGAISSHSGLGIYDPATGAWSTLEGTYMGQPVVGNGALHGAGVINDIAYDERTGDLYIVGNWAPTLERPDAEYPLDNAAALRIDADGVYHLLGYDLKAEDPGKPTKGIYSIVLDTSTTPPGIYVGGTFGYYGPVPTSHERFIYNVAQYDYEVDDWRPVGEGIFLHLSELDEGSYPNGLPGLPARPREPGYVNYSGFIVEGFPRVRALALDGDGNLYAGGTLGIVDRDPDIASRHEVETFGLARYDAATNTWGQADVSGGVSRDIDQMTWLDDTRLLLTGSFVYGETWNQLHNVAILDTETGVLEPLGGGLLIGEGGHVVGAQVVHDVRGNELWFAGYFDHAGVNANATHAAPVPSSYIAMFDPTQILDPNHYIEVDPVTPIEGPTGFSSVSVTIDLAARVTQGEGVITWYERRNDGSYTSKGTGETYRANLRVSPGSGDVFYYVAVTTPDGVEGGKIPVRIPVR